MGARMQSLTGMHDLLPADSVRWDALVARFGEHLGNLGAARIATPILEERALFLRLGEGTDVVSKEMYEFVDRDGTPVALRPESTAGVARAFLQHQPVLPFKVWYCSEHFRHERPQRGRLRQHHQLGAEVFGVSDPAVDAELITTLWDFFSSLGLSEIELQLNSIGTASERVQYAHLLGQYFRSHLGDLDERDRAKVDSHPLRILDSKHDQSQAIIEDAPKLLDSLGAEARTRFDWVIERVSAAGIPARVTPRLVRGLDYYTDTVFEIVSLAMDAAQSTIGGGGRYDGLIASLGGSPTPGVGFGAGIERILLACQAEQVFDSPSAVCEVFVVDFDGDGVECFEIALELRRNGISAERSYDGRSLRAQMKQANRSGARFAVIMGPTERQDGQFILRPLLTDAPQQSFPRDSLVSVLKTQLANR